ncbi:MAG: hypothetical protein WBY88_17805 [Desulfosarcina sp.]
MVSCVSIGLSVGCSDEPERPASQTTVTSQEVKNEAAEAVDTTQAYTQQQMEEYQQQVEQQLNDFDRKLEDLEARTESMQADAKAQYEETIAALKQKLSEAADAFDELKQESSEAWSRTKVKIDEMIDDLQRRFDQADASS